MSTEVKQPGQQSFIVPILAVGAVGVVGYFGYKYLDKKREQAAIEQATVNARKSELSLKKTKERIATIENKAFVSGINGFGKQITVNIVNQAKELINQFYLSVTDSNGITKYHKKSPVKINQTIVKDAIFKTPLKELRKLASIYNIYTGGNLLEDSQRLDLNLYTQIKKLYEIAYKKYPATFK